MWKPCHTKPFCIWSKLIWCEMLPFWKSLCQFALSGPQTKSSKESFVVIIISNGISNSSSISEEIVKKSSIFDGKLYKLVIQIKNLTKKNIWIIQQTKYIASVAPIWAQGVIQHFNNYLLMSCQSGFLLQWNCMIEFSPLVNVWMY